MAERAKFIVMKSEEEKKLTIIRAEAESESAKIFNNAINTYGRGIYIFLNITISIFGIKKT